MTFIPAIDPDIEYPDSDGKPMADNTEQYEWIVKIKENLEILFANSPNVFIAGDLLWYPVQDKKITGPVAPDVMVVLVVRKEEGVPINNGKKITSLLKWSLKFSPLLIV